LSEKAHPRPRIGRIGRAPDLWSLAFLKGSPTIHHIDKVSRKNGRVPDSPADVTAAIEELIEAYQVLRHRILINEGILSEALEQINGGAGVGQTLMTIPSLRERRAAEEAVLSLYDTRTSSERS
jgi:hypothetical protein